MRPQFFILIIALAASAPLRAQVGFPELMGPDLIGNGGDSVRCEPSASSPFKGLYSLDHLLTYRTMNENADVVPVRDWEESSLRILGILEKKQPDLYFSFKFFTRHLENYHDFTQPIVWQEAGFGLVDVQDERIIRKLPENCYDLKNGSIQIIQTVVRVARPDSTAFEFDPEVYREFKEYAPLQFSFLLVHEWLWSITQDVRIIRSLNRFLHSEEADRLDEEGFRMAVIRQGVTLEPKFTSLCDRSQPVRDFAADKVHKPCELITPEDLEDRESTKHMTLVDADFRVLGLDDLAGFKQVQYFKATNGRLEHLWENQFANLKQLTELDLSGNLIGAIHPSQFLHNDKLVKINLSNNQIKSFALDDPEMEIDHMDLTDNRISFVRIPRVLDPYKKIKFLALGNNDLETLDPAICGELFSPYDFWGGSGITFTATLDISGNPIATAQWAEDPPQCRMRSIKILR